MRRRHVLADPWASALGVGAGGIVFAATPGMALATGLGVCVAAVVYSGKVGAGALIDRNNSGARTPAGAGNTGAQPSGSPRPRRGSAAEVWNGRCAKALREMHSVIATCPDGSLRDDLQSIELQTGGTTERIDKLASEVAAFDLGIERIATRDLYDKRTALGVVNPDTHPEKAIAAAAVEEQIDAYERLMAARGSVLARMESTTLGIEALNAQIAELIATSNSAAAGYGSIVEIGTLQDDLEAIRAGLTESEAYLAEVLGSEGDSSAP